MNKIEGNSSLSSNIFHILEKAIVSGEYRPGESLIETKISEKYNVSRTPVREALHQLEQAGLVKIVPNKGTVVVGVTEKDVMDIYAIRILLEGYAAELAAKNITDRELAALRDIVDMQDFFSARGNVEKCAEFDGQFHRAIYSASRSTPLLNVLSLLHNYISRARSVSFRTPGRGVLASGEHIKIYKALENHDPKESKRLMEEHVKNARMNVLKNVDKE